MTIKYFLITAGYVFWAYIMLFICLKLIKDLWQISRKDKKKQAIADFFAADKPQNLGKFKRFVLIYLTKSNIFFEELLKQYEVHKDSFTKEQKDFFYKFVIHAIEYKIRLTDSSDNLTKALIIRAIGACGVHSIKIDKFLTVSKTGSKIEKDWMRSYDELNKKVSEEKK